jgi:hypothetical protein
VEAAGYKEKAEAITKNLTDDVNDDVGNWCQ